jgi:hypothetical protein
MFNDSEAAVPPFVLELPKSMFGDNVERGEEAQAEDGIQVSLYKPPNNGPYPENQRRVNQVPFTPTQGMCGLLPVLSYWRNKS